MSLGTGALEVGQEPEHLGHSKELSTATLRAGTTPAYICQLAPSHWKSSVENTHLTPILTKAQKGRDGLGARICKDLLKQQVRKDQLKNASMRCNVRHKISKRLLRSLYRSPMPGEEPADCISLQFNFA